MALSTYADLQSSVTSFLHRSDLSSIIPDLILIGEKRIFREVRSIEMESALSVAITSGVAALPSDYLELKFAYIDGTPVSKLGRASADQIYEQWPNRSSSGKPVKIAREGQNFIFGPYPSSGYTLGGVYYAAPVSIQTSANALFLAHPDLYLYASLLAAAPYLKDDSRIIVWENEYRKIFEQIHTKTAWESASGGGMAVRAA